MHYLIGKTKSVAILLFALVVVVTQQPSLFAEDNNTSVCFTKESLLKIQEASDHCCYQYDLGDSLYIDTDTSADYKHSQRPEGRSIRLFIFNGTDPCDLCNYHEFGAKQIPVTELIEQRASIVLFSELSWAIVVDSGKTIGEWDETWAFSQPPKIDPPPMPQFAMLLNHIKLFQCRDITLCH